MGPFSTALFPALSAAGASLLALTLRAPIAASGLIPSTVAEPATGVLLDSTLTVLALAGAVGGGFMAVAFFPKKDQKQSIRTELIRWLGCAMFGGTFSPFIIDHILPKWEISVSPSTALATSAFLAMFAWAIVAIIPTIISAIPDIIKSYIAAKK